MQPMLTSCYQSLLIEELVPSQTMILGGSSLKWIGDGREGKSAT